MSDFDADDLFLEWFELWEIQGESTPQPSNLWPNLPPHILDDLDRRAEKVRGMRRFDGIDLSVLKKGYRPSPNSSYELVERLDDGNSGFGVVWKAWNKHFNRNVVFKFCKTPLDHRAVETLHNELRLAQAIDNPAIVKVVDEGLEATIPYLVYEYVDGVDLAHFLEHHFQENGALSPDVAAAVMLRIVDVVAAAHSCKVPVVHRDLKPQNILVANRHDLAFLDALGAQDLRLIQVRLLDFGIGGYAAAGRTSASLLRSKGRFFDGVGTFMYASPQQLQGHPADASDDVYALGVIWCELLSGRIGNGAPSGPWQRELSLNGVTTQQIEILESCLEVDCEQRIGNAGELARQIRGAYPGVDVMSTFSKQATWAIDEKNKGGGVNAFKSWNVSLAALSVESAQLLTTWEGSSLRLNLEEMLSFEVAASLARWRGITLSVHCTNSLSLDALETLCAWDGESLALGALPSISVDVVERIVKWKGRLLSLCGVLEPPAKEAGALSKRVDDSLKREPRRLSVDAVEGFAKWKGRTLRLCGFLELSAKAADALSNWSGDFLEWETHRLSVDAAAGLARWTGRRLEVRLLERSNGGDFSLKSDDGVSAEAALALSKWKGRILKISCDEKYRERVLKAFNTWISQGGQLSLCRT